MAAPAPEMRSDATGADDVVVTAKRAEPAYDTATPAVAADVAASAPAESSARKAEGGRVMPYPYPPRPRPYPQAGMLTAGEHDDLLNPELYAEYVRRSNLGQDVPALPRLDTARVLTVAVNDSAGRPVPFARVELACSDGNSLALTTAADGTVSFFPALDRLSPQVRVRAAGQEWRPVTIGRSGGQRLNFTTASQAQAARKLDLMLVIDTTGSMGDEIRYLQTELGAIVDALRARHRGLDLRVGFVFYRDLGDDYVTATVPLSANIDAAQNELAQRWAGGGGDYPEAMEQALIRAARQGWRGDAVKSLLLVADAPPHDENFGLAWRAAQHLRASRVHIVPVAASGVADKAEYAMRAMAALTQSRYTFLTDDSGIGNPHARPAIDCYLVTRLDALLRRVIDSQLSGRRIEPDKAEVIRSVGDYDNGRCILPRGWQQDWQQDQ
jgi:Mg-chelatase subunit ChlD